MTGKTLDLTELLGDPDQLAHAIARMWTDWDIARAYAKDNWQETRKYIFATDTTKTTNSKLPWKNKTTIPKLTQIRDNLYSNYMASLFPKRKWLDWLADREDDSSLEKRESILAYMQWAIAQPQFKTEVGKCVLDYIDYGNPIGLVEWIDQRVEKRDGVQSGYVGPVPRRISPYDIVFNPTAPSFVESPKIIRSLITMGELKKRIDSMSPDENREECEKLFDYMSEYRTKARQYGGDVSIQDSFYNMDGFTSFSAYLTSDYVEVLTFYGDMYDWEKKELLQNHVIMVVDRHKLISKKPNPSYFGYPPIFHVGWRPRQDNLWAMGPLDNLIGLQYRLDHIENLKADVFDLIAFPVLKVKGYVQDFEWGPMQRIITDQDGDVEMVAPPFQILQVNNEIQYIVAMMEEMAGSPKEAMGFRTPGEKTAYEVQRLENAASRIFQNKIAQFEEQFLEPLLNAMLEMARRNMSVPQEINGFDQDLNIQTFMTLTPQDITGAGKIKPMAARHFAERAETVQNLTNMYASGIGQDPLVQAHVSGVQVAKVMEELLDLTDYHLVQPYIRLSEQAQAQRLQAAHGEQTMMQMGTPSGLTPDDGTGPDMMQAAQQQPPQGMPR